jgi:hypothetical protein
VQIMASGADGGRSLSQHSQLGRSCSIACSLTAWHQCRGLNEGDVEIEAAFGVNGEISRDGLGHRLLQRPDRIGLYFR